MREDIFMIQVKDILNFPEMQSGIVRAGEMGLDRYIHWVHVIDHEDMGNFLEGGELLLTSGQIWSTAEELLTTLLKKQIAGIVFATGRYLMDVPKEALVFGDQHAIPIIEVPFRVSFVKVTRSIHEAILHQERDNVSKTSLIEKIKTTNHMTDICHILSKHLRSYIFITDPKNRVLIKSSPRRIGHINDSFIIQKLRELLETKRTEDISKQVSSVATNIPPYALYASLANKFMLWMFHPYLPLGKTEEKIFQYAKTILEHMIVNSEEVKNILTKCRLRLLDALLEAPKHIKHEAYMFNLDQSSKWVVSLLVFNRKWCKEDVIFLRDCCQQWLDEAQDISGFCERYEDQLIIFMSLDALDVHYNEKLYHLYHDLKNNMKDIDCILIVSQRKKELHHFSEAYKETKVLHRLVQTKRNPHVIYFADEFQRDILLYEKIDVKRAQALQRAILPKELLTEKESFLYETLKCLVEHNFNREQVAKTMHIHRNTLRYRIKRIETLLQDDLSSSVCQFWIRIAFNVEAIALNNDE